MSRTNATKQREGEATNLLLLTFDHLSPHPQSLMGYLCMDYTTLEEVCKALSIRICRSLINSCHTRNSIIECCIQFSLASDRCHQLMLIKKMYILYVNSCWFWSGLWFVVYIYRVAGLLRRVPVRCRLHLLFILFTCGHDGTESCV